MIISTLFALLALSCQTAWAQDDISISTHPFLPTYVALSPNINDFPRFADGGPDSNWYVGYNNCWIVRLPPAPDGDFARAFIGAKLGRAKTQADDNRPWVREIITGKIYMAVSQNASFSAKRSFFLTAAEEVPAEPDPQSHVAGVSSSEWFWAEVPMSLVSFSRPNYLVIWSPTQWFVSASSAPILAAASIDSSVSRETSAWNNSSISGVPPRNAGRALQTPINNIIPALAIKLVPPVTSEISITDTSVLARDGRYYVRFSAGGENISEAWIEYSRDQLDWAKVSRLQRRPPFVFTILPSKLPPVGGFLRGVARDISGNVGHGLPETLPYAAP